MHRIDLEELPPLLDVPTAATVLGIGRTLAYDLVRTDRFPTPVLRVGKLIRIPTAGLRVAIASNHNELLDGHFGSCERFLIYQVSPSEIRLVGVRSTLSTADAEDKNAARAELINDCQILGVQSIGGPAAAKVVRAGVHPVKRPIGGEARDMLAELQGRLLAPPPWLAQIMGVPAHSLAKFEADMEEIEP